MSSTQTRTSHLELFNQFKAAYYTQHTIPEYLSQSLILYKRLVWSSHFFLSSWNQNVGTYAAGTLRKYNHMFHVQFINGCSLGAIKAEIAVGNNPQLSLSFRKHPKLPAIVIVDFCKEERESK